MTREGRLRSSLRVLRQPLDFVVQRQQGNPLSCFWWDGHPNFGDQLTRFLLPAYGALPILHSAGSASACGVGSLIHLLPDDYSGWLWGTGTLDGRPRDLASARIAALRGHLTADVLGASHDCALGDPGLLVPRVAPASARRWSVGVVPHFSHWNAAIRQDWAGRRDVLLIDPTRSVHLVLRDIQACDSILTSSLHGLIVADASGIPASWFVPRPHVLGGDHKFRDHESVVLEPGTQRQLSVDHFEDIDIDLASRVAIPADVDRVATVQRALDTATREMLTQLHQQEGRSSLIGHTWRGFRSVLLKT